MPMLDISTSQISFQNPFSAFRTQIFLHSSHAFSNEKRLSCGWKPFRVRKKGNSFNIGCIETQPSVIRAVAMVEPKSLLNGRHEDHNSSQRGVDSRIAMGIQHPSSIEDSETLDEGEKLRRTKISVANKGKSPWNKGRKHSSETLELIRERTRLAMQDPKVRMKLAKPGKVPSEETKMKIGVGVRLGWNKRHQKLMLQDTCYFEWQNLIAEASRRGFVGQEELQWDSYKILDKQLEEEWLECVEVRKRLPRPSSQRARKSLEQRRKISEAISAKWADPAYRERVCSALAKYHDTPHILERKPRRSPIGERSPRTPSSTKKNPVNKRKTKKKRTDTDDLALTVIKSQNQPIRLLKKSMPLYKDPLASSKLKMIKNIRAQRVAAESKKTKAIKHAKLLIGKAQKAAQALEAAAVMSTLARASLIEARQLIADAIQSLHSIEIGQIDYHENSRPSSASVELVNELEKENNLGKQSLRRINHTEINGLEAVESDKIGIKDFGSGIDFPDLLACIDGVLLTRCRGYNLNGKEELSRTDSSVDGFLDPELDGTNNQSSYAEQLSQLETNDDTGHEIELLPNGAQFQSKKEQTPPKSTTVTKKWVRGRLVEVVEGE